MNDINQLDLQNWINKTSARSDLKIFIETTIFVIIELLGLAGNIMVVLAVYRNKTLRTITHQYVVTLAIADLSVALIIFPMSIRSSVTGLWAYGPDVCYFQGTSLLIWASFTMSVVSITAINRFFCVVKPNIYRTLFTTKNTMITIAVTLVFCCTLVIGISLGFSGTYHFGPHLFCIPIFPTKQRQMVIMLTTFVLFIFIPMATMSICYFKIHRRVKEHAKKVAPMLGRSKVRNLRQGVEEARITRVVSIVLVLFFLFWIPICVIGTLFVLGATIIPRPIHLMYDYFLVSNIASNPIVYGFCNQSFRSEYANILRCKKRLPQRIVFSVEEFTGSVHQNQKHELDANRAELSLN